MSSPFQIGFQAVQQAADRSKSRGSGPFLRYILWEPEETKIIRFLTDDIITAPFYEFVQNAQGSASDFLILPGMDKTFGQFVNPATGIGLVRGMGDERGKMVNPTARVRTVAPVVVLTEEADGVHDAVREINIGGSQYLGREFGIVKQSDKLFWSTMGLYNSRYGTICDRPYQVKRTGKGLDTDYGIIPLDKDPDWTDNETGLAALQERYGYGKTQDREDPDRFMYIPMTLLQWAEKHASEDRMRELLGGGTAAPTPPVPPAGSFAAPAATDEAQAAAPAATDDKFNDLRARLNRHKADGG
jgi:hypothetical protein